DMGSRSDHGPRLLARQAPPDIADGVAPDLEARLRVPCRDLLLGREPLRRVGGAPDARLPVRAVARELANVLLDQAGVDVNAHASGMYCREQSRSERTRSRFSATAGRSADPGPPDREPRTGTT